MASCIRAFPLALALLAAACGQAGDVPVDAVVIGKDGAAFEKGVRLSYAGQQVRAATSEGLVALDEQGRVIPALADRWIVTDDGLSYIFRLRDGTWLDGAPLDAATAVSAVRRALAGVGGTPLAEENSGISAIVARAGRVIEIQLSGPNPDLLQFLAQPELGLVRNGRGAGPMRLAREGSAAILSPIAPGKRGLPDVAGWEDRVRVMKLRTLSTTGAIDRFERGDAVLVMGGRMEGYPLARDVGIARGKVELDPVAGLFGLAVAGTGGFLASAENREAIAMAIDRDSLASALGADGWVPTTRIVAPGMEGDPGTVGERWSGETFDARQTVASGRISRWEAGHGPIVLKLALPEGPGADILFSSIARDMAAIGIEARRVGEGAPADLRMVDAVARFPRASWFLAQLSCSARGAPCSPEADRLAAQARRMPDMARRAALFAEAEAELTRANVFVPLGQPLRWSLLRRNVTGFAPNRWGVHPLMALTLLPK